jgi:phosphotriesterase-related protein
LSGKSEAELTDFFVSEIAIGTVRNDAEDFDEERHPCKAGMIKTALVSPDESMEKKLFSAGAAASKETGAPLMIHTEASNAEKELLGLLSFLTGKGVCENKIIFAHLDRTKGDLGVHKELAGEGCLLDYDTVMRYKYHSDEKEIEIISEMLGAGFEDNILLSLDTTRERLKGYGGVPGLAGMQNHFVPRLKAAGVTRDILDKIFVQNAARVLDMADCFERRKS